MDWIRVHLILNHLPVMGFPIVAFFLAVGIFKKNDLLVRTALVVLTGLSISVFAVYQTGDQAESRAEKLFAYNENLVEQHEAAGKWAMIWGLVTGAAALSGIIFCKNQRIQKIAPKTALGLAVFTTTVLAMTAHHGSKMRHGEVPGEMPYPEFLPTGVVPGDQEAQDTLKQYHGDGEGH